MKRWQSILLGVTISAVTLAYALRGNDLSQIGEEAARGRYLYVIPMMVVAGVGLLLRAFRWRALLDDRIAVWRSFHIMNVGYFFNAWLPLRLGEVARSYLVTRLTPPISIFTSLSSIVVERLVDLLAVVMLIVLAISISPVTPEIVAGAQISAAIAIVGILALALFAARQTLAHRLLNIALRILPFLERLGLRRVVDHALDGIAPLASPRGVSRALFWTAAAWTPSVVAGFILMYVYYDAPRWEAALLMIATASIAIALPAVPGSVGPFEAAVIVGLEVGGMVGGANTPERAFAFAVLLHILNVGLYAGLGVLGLAREGVTFREVIRSARQLAERREQHPDVPATVNESAPHIPTES